MHKNSIIILLCLAALAGCERLPYLSGYVPPYQQGNILDEKQLAKLKPGMNKQRVAYVLGLPVLEDIFAQDEWNYVYTYRQGHGSNEWQRAVLTFSGDKLVRLKLDDKGKA